MSVISTRVFNITQTSNTLFGPALVQLIRFINLIDKYLYDCTERYSVFLMKSAYVFIHTDLEMSSNNKCCFS